MDLIKIPQVNNVDLLRKGERINGTLHFTAHHMIFRERKNNREVWICYPMISDVSRQPFTGAKGISRMRIVCKDFTFLGFDFLELTPAESRQVHETLTKLVDVNGAAGHIERLYAYLYKPGSLERAHDGWTKYSPQKEYERMGALIEPGDDNGENGETGGKREPVKAKWRITSVNKNYSLSMSYPQNIIVPSSITDTVITHAAKFRSKSRIPALSYFHKFNECTITRCSQPMVGIKQSRSVQDEKSIAAIFATTQPENETVVGAGQKRNLIVDARPITNATAQMALGGGSENMEHYKPAKKIYLGIDNVHVMRDSLNKVVDALRHGDVSAAGPNMELLYKSQWLHHVRLVLEGAVTVAHQVHYQFSHVVIHCSDGWDRTAQLTSLSQIFLDPYYRTIDGFITLVEKEWLSFGHRFAERSGIGRPASSGSAVSSCSSEDQSDEARSVSSAAAAASSAFSAFLPDKKRIKYSGPIFHQFLDCVYQIIYQYPTHFEYTERFLRRVLYHVYSCQYGTFLFNSERERQVHKVSTLTRSVWDHFLARRSQFVNPDWQKPEAGAHVEDCVIFADIKKVRWWPEMFGRSDSEMNVKEQEVEPECQEEDSINVDENEENFESTPAPSVPPPSVLSELYASRAGTPKAAFPSAHIGRGSGSSSPSPENITVLSTSDVSDKISSMVLEKSPNNTPIPNAFPAVKLT